MFFFFFFLSRAERKFLYFVVSLRVGPSVALKVKLKTDANFRLARPIKAAEELRRELQCEKMNDPFIDGSITVDFLLSQNQVVGENKSKS